jgi:hypothetical protein
VRRKRLLLPLWLLLGSVLLQQLPAYQLHGGLELGVVQRAQRSAGDIVAQRAANGAEADGLRCHERTNLSVRVEVRHHAALVAEIEAFDLAVHEGRDGLVLWLGAVAGGDERLADGARGGLVRRWSCWEGCLEVLVVERGESWARFDGFARQP